MSPLLPESGSVALTVRMTLPAGVCSGSSTWKRRKPQSASGSPHCPESQASLGGESGAGQAAKAKVVQPLTSQGNHRQGVCALRPFKRSWGSPALCWGSSTAAHTAQVGLQQGPAQVSPQTFVWAVAHFPPPLASPLCSSISAGPSASSCVPCRGWSRGHLPGFNSFYATVTARGMPGCR